MLEDISYKSASHVTFILGGARSGKSAFAEEICQKLAAAENKQLIYIATAEAFDQEMQERIDLHIHRRGDHWQTINTPLDLPDQIRNLTSDQVALVDCLTIWLNNLIYHEKNIHHALDDLSQALKAAPCPVMLVSNEIGLGLVPMDKLSRRFRDHSGTMNQQIAALASTVYFVAAGLPIKMKPTTL